MSYAIARPLLAILWVLYLTLGFLYAWFTPPWQAPDEPAHYNYIRHLAEERSIPVLQPGDYPHDYVVEIVSAGFPPDYSIEPLRYEFHQPPLYYLLATPVYWVSGGELLTLRLFSVLIGGVVVLLGYQLGRTLFPEQPAWALGVGAFIAFVPMHVAMMAAVNNDALAEATILGALVLTTGYVLQRPWASQPHSLLVLGVVLGLGLITKATVYVLVPVIGIALLLRHWRDVRSAGEYTWQQLIPWRPALLVLLPTLLIALPWWLRNMALYGWGDFLGLQWHDEVVVGQPRTSEWVEAHGLSYVIREGLTTTFRSFWGQFGWMGVVLDSRIYLLLQVLTGAVLLGLMLWWRRGFPGGRKALPALGILALSGCLTVASVLWYNLTFIQHQGRYLFPALGPIAVFFVIGWWQLCSREDSRRAAVVVGIVAFATLAFNLLTANPILWPLLFIGALAAALFVCPWLPRLLEPLPYLAPFVLLYLIALVSLFGFIIPQLAR